MLTRRGDLLFKKELPGLKQILAIQNSVIYLAQPAAEKPFYVGFIDGGAKPGMSRVTCRLAKNVNAVGMTPDAYSAGHLFVMSDDGNVHVFRPTNLVSSPIPTQCAFETKFALEFADGTQPEKIDAM